MAGASALTTQGRVIWALMMREIHTIHGQSRLGYFWIVMQTSFIALSLWVLREVLRLHSPHGLSPLEYVLSGYIVWTIIMTTTDKCMVAMNSNKAILYFPQVTQVDIMVARSVVVLATQSMTLVLLAGFCNMLGFPFAVENLPLFILSFALASLLALSMGLLMASLSFIWPTLHRLMPMIWRTLFHLSGILYSPMRISKEWGHIFWWNPIFQVIEFTRYSISPMYYSDLNVSMKFLMWLIMICLSLGLLFEKYTRRYHHYG